MPNYTKNYTLSRKIEDFLDASSVSTSQSILQSETAGDAFGRLRTSSPLTLFDSSHRFADNGLWSTGVAGSGTATFNANQGLIDCSVTALSGSSVKRETTKVFSYQPGKSLLVLNTFVMSPAKTGLVQRVGYYGADNGIYFELDGTTLNIVKRTIVNGSLQNIKIPQSQWNGDKLLDGTGSSGFTLDISKAQILWMDFEWLGVGSVRVGFVINGKFVVCHTFHHANIIASTYITTASLPLRYEIENASNTGSTSTLKQICSTVISEGGYQLYGAQQSIGTAINAPYNLITAAGTDYPVLTMRLKSTKLDAVVILTALSILPVSTTNYKWKVVSGGATTGGSEWQPASADSAVEYKMNASAITGGRILASGYMSSTTQSKPSLDILKEALFKFQLERNGLSGVPNELSLVVSASTASGGNPAQIHASLDWEEISR
jgi:hypothetical protein